MLYCAERTNRFCQGIRAGIAKSEAEVDLALAQEPLYLFMGKYLLEVLIAARMAPCWLSRSCHPHPPQRGRQ